MLAERIKSYEENKHIKVPKLKSMIKIEQHRQF
ncbi:hypothetical protein [Clostridium tagluense]